MKEVHKEDKNPEKMDIKQLIDASSENRISSLSKICKERKKKDESK